MTRLIIASALGMWAGIVLLVSCSSWGRRISLAERLRPHTPGSPGRPKAGVLSAESARQALGPLASSIGSRLATILGVHEALEVRLRRVHSPLDATEFRLRQVGLAAATLGVGVAVALVVPIPVGLVALLLLGAPFASFLWVEQRLSTQSSQWKRRLFLEAPVIADQIAMHLASGASLSNAITHVTQRGSGAIATDLRTVLLRIRHGLSESDALREWAEVADVPEIGRLVSVLRLHGEAGDLDRIVSDEARSLRREVHRELISSIESKNQQVWIPVTVSALVPGVIVLAVPFLAALRSFSG
jgi:tight adherence protein C